MQLILGDIASGEGLQKDDVPPLYRQLSNFCGPPPYPILFWISLLHMSFISFMVKKLERIHVHHRPPVAEWSVRT